MTDWLRKFWWALAAGLVFVAWIVLTILGKRDAAEKLAAVAAAARARSELEHLDKKNDASNKALAELADQRAAVEASHKDRVALLERQLKRTSTMTDAEIDADLKRRGHR